MATVNLLQLTKFPLLSLILLLTVQLLNLVETSGLMPNEFYTIVYCAYIKTPDRTCYSSYKKVAAKTINESEVNVDALINEAISIRDFNHKNILSLVGVTFDDTEMPIILLPFMENGDLLTYLRNGNNNLTAQKLLHFALDIAEGMYYLSIQRYVHRNIAARNCFLDETLCVKIGDFGLLRDVYESDYYSSDNTKYKLPVKWMAPETLLRGIYSMKSDVWSYGLSICKMVIGYVDPNIAPNLCMILCPGVG
ncbi:unnamed protein product [Oppiella nova]|uniref:Protein kinase domain-containing protein n=1 Tax=Oppiella nova TaxID=334625 RepID=A0A7R9QS00_9ACAR|nr:unnamed protein product [Oppiella nova]CAG2173532.1 unnamed protein product [Oppiella nova]